MSMSITNGQQSLQRFEEVYSLVQILRDEDTYLERGHIAADTGLQF